MAITEAIDAAFQSTRPVRGETKARSDRFKTLIISIHSPRAGRDAPACRQNRIRTTFQSSRPVRGET